LLTAGARQPTNSTLKKASLTAAVIAWGAVALGGTLWTWKYKSTPAPSSVAPAQWPTETTLSRRPGQPLLVMLAHPRCVCTRASVSELAELLGEVGSRVDAAIVFVRPEGTSDDWIEGDLLRAATAIPGLRVVVDRGGKEVQRFGALASGTVLLYDGAGKLLFSGGITAARGHVGDNLGRRRIVDLVNKGTADRTTSPVFGCDLLDARERRSRQ